MDTPRLQIDFAGGRSFTWRVGRVSRRGFGLVVAAMTAGTALGFSLEGSTAPSGPHRAQPIAAHSTPQSGDSFLGGLGTTNAVDKSVPVGACPVAGSHVGCHVEWLILPPTWNPPPWQ